VDDPRIAGRVHGGDRLEVPVRVVGRVQLRQYRPALTLALTLALSLGHLLCEQRGQGVGRALVLEVVRGPLPFGVDDLDDAPQPIEAEGGLALLVALSLLQHDTLQQAVLGADPQ